MQSEPHRREYHRQRRPRDRAAADALPGNAPSDRVRSPRIWPQRPFSTTAADRCERTRLPSSPRCWTRSGSSGCRSSAPRWAACGGSAWPSTRRIALPPSRRSESPPWRCPACTATRSSPRSPHPACASSPHGSARRTSQRHADRWPVTSSALAAPSERPTVLRGRPRGSAPARLSDGDTQPHAARHAVRPAPPGERPWPCPSYPTRASRSSLGATPPSSTTPSAAAR